LTSGEKNLEKVKVKLVIREFVTSLNLMGHTENISSLRKRFTIWDAVILIDQIQFNINTRHMDQGKPLDILTPFRRLALLDPIQVTTFGSSDLEPQTGCLILLKPQVPSDGTHDREVIASVNTYSLCVNWALMFEIFNERQILDLKPWLSVSFNLKAQVERIVDVWSWMESEYVLQKSAMWNSWTSDFAKQGMYECIDQPVLRNGKNMHAYVLCTCDNRDEFLGTTLVELFAEYGLVSWACGIILQVHTSSEGFAAIISCGVVWPMVEIFGATNTCHEGLQKFQCDFHTEFMCAAHWITVPHPVQWRYLVANNGETLSIIMASLVIIGVSIMTVTSTSKYSNVVSMFINIVSLTIQFHSLSSIEVSFIHNPFHMEDKFVKLHYLGSSALELIMNKGSKFWWCAAKGNFNLVNAIVDPLLQFLEIEKDYVILDILVFGTTIFFDLFGLYELSERSLEQANNVHKFQLGFSSISNKILAAFLMFACYLEGLFHLTNVKMVVLNSSVRVIPWDPGKFNVFMARVACECCWRKALSIYGSHNLVYGRRNLSIISCSFE
jgi:hypothetical protein